MFIENKIFAWTTKGINTYANGCNFPINFSYLVTTDDSLEDCVKECIENRKYNGYVVIPSNDSVYCFLFKNVTKSDANAYVRLKDEQSICGIITRLYMSWIKEKKISSLIFQQSLSKIAALLLHVFKS